MVKELSEVQNLAAEQAAGQAAGQAAELGTDLAPQQEIDTDK